MGKVSCCWSKPLMASAPMPWRYPSSCPGGDQAAARQGRDREPAVVTRDDDVGFLAPPLEVRVFVQVGVVREGVIMHRSPDGLSGGLVGQAPAHEHAALQGDVECGTVPAWARPRARRTRSSHKAGRPAPR